MYDWYRYELSQPFFLRMFFFFFFFFLELTACQDYFIYFEPSQSLGGTKMGDPREKPPDHPQAELSLSHM